MFTWFVWYCYRWQKSGALNIPLEAGQSYTLMVGFEDGNYTQYYYYSLPATYPETGWGELRGNVFINTPSFPETSTLSMGSQAYAMKVRTGVGEEDADEDGILACEDCDDSTGDLASVTEDADCDGVLTADDCDDEDSTNVDSCASCTGDYTVNDAVDAESRVIEIL